MNQFKKAKQLRMESGQTTESITDLKTAGVAPKNEKENYSEDKTIATEKKNEDNTNETSTIAQNVLQPNLQKNYTELGAASAVSPESDINPSDTQDNIIPQPITTIESDIVHSTESIIETTTVTPTTNSITMNSTPIQAIITTNVESDIAQSNDITIADSNTVLHSTIRPLPESTNNVAEVLQPLTNNSSIQTSTPVINSTTMAPVTQTSAPNINEAKAPILTIPTEYHSNSVSQSSTVPVVIKPSNEQQLQEQKYQEVPNTRQNKPAKKSAPNIFAPKGEAKSMRKSLVLKPTSVKIAENYCSKNGGSFNELIQTLLDNFIDEYGL